MKPHVVCRVVDRGASSPKHSTVSPTCTAEGRATMKEPSIWSRLCAPASCMHVLSSSQSGQGGRPGDLAPDLHGIPLAQPEQLGMLDRVSPPERQRLTEQRTEVGEELAAHLRAW